MNLKNALCVALIGAAPASLARADSVVQLSLQVTTNATGGTYKVFETINHDSAGTLGIYSTDVQVVGLNGISINDPTIDPNTFNDLPTGFVKITNTKTEQAGFFNFNQQNAVTPNGADFTGGQAVTYDFNATTHHGNIATGFGIPGTSSGNVGDTLGFTWGDPALVAEGTFTGIRGMIEAFGTATTPSAQNPGGTNTLLLPAVLPSASGSAVGPHYAGQVVGASSTVGVVPVPAPFWGAAFLLSGLGVVRKLRKA